MTHNTRIFFRIILAIIAIIAIIGLALYFGPTARESRGNDAAKAVLQTFGSKLKNVALSGDSAAVTASIQDNYAPYVTPELLTDWKANHAHAPGRMASSTVPDRLTVETMVTQGSGRVINGEVILVSSEEKTDDIADTVPYVAQLIQTPNGWKIAAYQEETVQTLKKIPTSDVDIPGAK